MNGDDDTSAPVDAARKGGGRYGRVLSFRLTDAELALLDKEAGPLPLGDYIRHCLFETPDARKRVFRRPIRDAEALGQVLDVLGRSRLPQNVNQLAKAAHSGSLPATPETAQALQQACADLKQVRHWLMVALGHLPERQAPTSEGP